MTTMNCPGRTFRVLRLSSFGFRDLSVHHYSATIRIVCVTGTTVPFFQQQAGWARRFLG